MAKSATYKEVQRNKAYPMKKNRKSSPVPREFNMSQHDKAVRLVEGGFVWQDGHYIGAKKVTSNDNPCDICHMDSICRMEMTDLCAACECLTNDRYLLYLATYGDNLEVEF